MNHTPILMTEDYWAYSQFSIVRHTGNISINGHVYTIVNKEGKTIFECSFEADEAGRDMAIEPGEPADLVRDDFIKYYRKLGRDRFIEVLEENPGVSDKVLERRYKELCKKKKV